MDIHGRDKAIPDLFQFLDQLSESLQDKNLKTKANRLVLNAELGRWKHLVQTFASSVQQTGGGPWLGVKDWNPFNQQLAIYSTPLIDRPLEGDFHHAKEVISDFHLSFHEAIHVALWEPFFLGEFSVNSERHFRDLSLTFEAAAFWFTDCVSAPAVRDALPDVELVKNRFAVTNDFLPFRAFKASGVKTERQGFEIYQLAFTGFETPLWDTGNPHARNIAKRLYGFYSASTSPLAHLYRLLKEIGVFDEFALRFTNSNLPSLFSHSTRSELQTVGPETYSWNLLRKKSRSWDTLTSAELKALRVRRGIQGRAYKALSLRYALKDERCFGVKHKWTRAENQNAIERIETYLAELELALLTLAQRKVNGAIAATRSADEKFEKARLRFKAFQVRTGVRDFVIPQLPSKSQTMFGRPSFLVDRRKPLNRKEIEIVLQLLLQNKDKQITHDALRIQLAAEISTLLNKMRNSRGRLELDRLLEKALLTEGILERWSIALESFHPSVGEFEEPVFKYD